jgi:hypothetical protein
MRPRRDADGTSGRVSQDEDRHNKALAGVAQQRYTAQVVRVGSVEDRQQWSRVEHERHLRRRMGDRLAGQLRGGETVGRSRNAKARTTRGVESSGLLVDRFGHDRRERDAAPAGLGRERVKRRALRGDGRATDTGSHKMIHES